MKKLIISILFFLIAFFGFASISWAQDVQGEYIQSFDSNIKINKEGTIDVVEKIVYDFDDLYKHGIYREIPFIKTNNVGKKLWLDFDVESVKDESGRSYSYKQTEGERLMRLKIGDANRTITGVHTYIISYKVKGALAYFSDHDELYWNVTGNEWTVPIARITSGVIWPVGILVWHLRPSFSDEICRKKQKRELRRQKWVNLCKIFYQVKRGNLHFKPKTNLCLKNYCLTLSHLESRRSGPSGLRM